MVRIAGVVNVKARIRAINGPEAIQEIGKALFIAADNIKQSAQHSITEGSISGKGHVVSVPGMPPNADTHNLDRQIESELVQPLKAVVSSNARYSAALEFGTSRMAARPFMLPAAQRERPTVQALVTRALNRVNSRKR
jgi:HK97 gp10 family phage protein